MQKCGKTWIEWIRGRVIEAHGRNVVFLVYNDPEHVETDPADFQESGRLCKIPAVMAQIEDPIQEKSG